MNTSTPTMPVVDDQNPPQLSRAVFIFLAVFVGIFGVHDFYAKRFRQGWIHLALLLPWILVFIVSILGVFGVTLYALSYSPNRQAMRETQHALKEGEKNIQDCEKTILGIEKQIIETKQELDAALAGRKKIIPQQDVPQKVIIPRPDEPQKEIVPQPSEPQKEIAPQTSEPQKEIAPRTNDPQKEIALPRPSIEIDKKYVQELEQTLKMLTIELGDIKATLAKMESQQVELRHALSELRALQGVWQAQAWMAIGPLWLYFFFYVLPSFSWLMAMFEVVYVTKDGAGRSLGY